MADQLYYKARERFARAQLDWDTANVWALLIDPTEYLVNPAHEFLAQVPGAAIISGPVELLEKTSIDGACGAAHTIFQNVVGADVGAVILYVHVTNEADSFLVAYITESPGLPFTPDSRDVAVRWATTGNKIFRL